VNPFDVGVSGLGSRVATYELNVKDRYRCLWKALHNAESL